MYWSIIKYHTLYYKQTCLLSHLFRVGHCITNTEFSYLLENYRDRVYSIVISGVFFNTAYQNNTITMGGFRSARNSLNLHCYRRVWILMKIIDRYKLYELTMCFPNVAGWNTLQWCLNFCGHISRCFFPFTSRYK